MGAMPTEDRTHGSGGKGGIPPQCPICPQRQARIEDLEARLAHAESARESAEELRAKEEARRKALVFKLEQSEAGARLPAQSRELPGHLHPRQRRRCGR